MEQPQQTQKQKIDGLLGPETGYVDLLDQHLLAKQAKENENRRFFPLRPSASGYCARLLAFDLMEYLGHAKYKPEQRSPSLIRLLNFGHSVEYHILRMFGDVEAFEVRYKQQALSFFPISPDRIIEGSLDFCLYFKDHKSIGDVKSKGDKFSSYRESKWDETDDKLRSMSSVKSISEQAYWVEDLPAFLKELNDPFFEDNFVQLNGYACTDFIKERGINHAFILQSNKNNSKLREIRFKPSQEVADYVKNKFTQVYNTVTTTQDPFQVEREYSLGSMRCSFCKRKKECYPDNDAKKEFFKTLPKKDWPKDTSYLGDVGALLEHAYTELKTVDSSVDKKKAIEQEIVHLLDVNNVRKVRFADKQVYEVKFLKSPYERLELRKAKL